MKRPHTLVGALLLCTLVVAAYPILSASEDPAPQAEPSTTAHETQASQAASEPADGTQICRADGAEPAPAIEAAPSLEATSCARCPDGSPMCWSDKQCDTFCGGKGFGACTRINSCYRCCLCAL